MDVERSRGGDHLARCWDLEAVVDYGQDLASSSVEWKECCTIERDEVREEKEVKKKRSRGGKKQKKPYLLFFASSRSSCSKLCGSWGELNENDGWYSDDDGDGFHGYDGYEKDSDDIMTVMVTTMTLIVKTREWRI
ncbi:hypothetical protein RHMOL_Rhmol07G0031000 [Rhododendron molle]|uniref:Uncharacterized protein n=1 Tax=Rhododendron molle TaxID=49168 RepID=A0ACC0MWE8_RHOML|nr:hypothetical protein RHMOL_Rhmol07G0031000 [Rhododendron molle]